MKVNKKSCKHIYGYVTNDDGSIHAMVYNPNNFHFLIIRSEKNLFKTPFVYNYCPLCGYKLIRKDGSRR